MTTSNSQIDTLVSAVAAVADQWKDRAWELRQLTSEQGTQPVELIHDLAEAGYAGLMIPVEFGGNGAGPEALTLATQALGASGLAP